ncbi:hypothetical protein PCK2_000860 [Pneumocystis canis]|nr:hypothetical protein PCK2_000860 [Pneumocystis canis]
MYFLRKNPNIEIWDLDVIDPLYPSVILGNMKKKKKKSKSVNSEYHTDSILSLSINKFHKNILASGSADTSIKLWNLESCSEIESVKWDLHDPFHFYVCTDSGMVYLLDTRNPCSNSKHINSIWTLQAHDGPISAFDINSFVKGYFITGSTDKSIKLWNEYGNDGGPNMILSKNIGVGKVFSARFSLDRTTKFSMVAGGSNGIIRVWDTFKNKAVRNIYGDRVIDLSCKDEIENNNKIKNGMFDANEY